MAYFTLVNWDNKDLLIEPKISYDEWRPQELAYNAEDKNAITAKLEQTLAKESTCILQGPPGTGKTYTVSKIIADYLKQEKTVCMTTMANKGLIELLKNDTLLEFIKKDLVQKTHLSADEAKQIPGLHVPNVGMNSMSRMYLPSKLRKSTGMR